MHTIIAIAICLAVLSVIVGRNVVDTESRYPAFHETLPLAVIAFMLLAAFSGFGWAVIYAQYAQSEDMAIYPRTHSIEWARKATRKNPELDLRTANYNLQVAMEAMLYAEK